MSNKEDLADDNLCDNNDLQELLELLDVKPINSRPGQARPRTCVSILGTAAPA